MRTLQEITKDLLKWGLYVDADFYVYNGEPEDSLVFYSCNGDLCPGPDAYSRDLCSTELRLLAELCDYVENRRSV